MDDVLNAKNDDPHKDWTFNAIVEGTQGFNEKLQNFEKCTAPTKNSSQTASVIHANYNYLIDKIKEILPNIDSDPSSFEKLNELQKNCSSISPVEKIHHRACHDENLQYDVINFNNIRHNLYQHIEYLQGVTHNVESTDLLYKGLWVLGTAAAGITSYLLIKKFLGKKAEVKPKDLEEIKVLLDQYKREASELKSLEKDPSSDIAKKRKLELFNKIQNLKNHLTKYKTA